MRYKSLPPAVRYASPDRPATRSADPRPRTTRSNRLGDIVATIPLILILPALVLPFVPAQAGIGGSLIASPQELAVLPTSGSPWTYLKGVADGDLGLPNLTDQDNKHDVKTLAVARRQDARRRPRRKQARLGYPSGQGACGDPGRDGH